MIHVSPDLLFQLKLNKQLQETRNILTMSMADTTLWGWLDLRAPKNYTNKV